MRHSECQNAIDYFECVAFGSACRKYELVAVEVCSLEERDIGFRLDCTDIDSHRSLGRIADRTADNKTVFIVRRKRLERRAVAEREIARQRSRAAKRSGDRRITLPCASEIDGATHRQSVCPTVLILSSSKRQRPGSGIARGDHYCRETIGATLEDAAPNTILCLLYSECFATIAKV